MLSREEAHEVFFENVGEYSNPNSGQCEDMVNHPPHYTTGKIEVLDFILDQRFGYLPGQVIKYLCRYRHKGNPLEDLKKAQFYLNKLVEEETSE